MKELPGFTAELSLGTKGGNYALVMKGAGYDSKLGVLPQIECGPCEGDPTSTTGWSTYCCFLDRCLRRSCQPPPPPPPPPPSDDCLYGHFCGPFCGRGDPVDDLDACCKEHDRCYKDRGWGACSCDVELMKCACPKQFKVWEGLEKAAAAGAICATFTSKVSSGTCRPEW
jgi:hypothetical protein